MTVSTLDPTTAIPEVDTPVRAPRPANLEGQVLGIIAMGSDSPR